jgi:drug/metabolite transporter (DMT)-like permease
MHRDTVKSDLLLLLAAAIWGFAFVAQRIGMDYIGPFTFNGIRFALGALSLLPLAFFNRRQPLATARTAFKSRAAFLYGGLLAGTVLFAGASLQQVGLIYTTAGKAGFITGLYVVIVPILGLLGRQRTDAGTWLGALLAVWGLYLLSIKSASFSISAGDLLEIIGAVFWAVHVIVIGWLSPRTDTVRLAITQFAVCSLLSLATAFVIETVSLDAIRQAAIPILYGGLLSVGVAYTLQVVVQRRAHASHAAIILSLEAAFAALGGWVILDETLSLRAGAGCALMMTGMLLSQLWGMKIKKVTS